MWKKTYRTLCIYSVFMLLAMSMAPLAAGDGCIAISYYGEDEEKQQEAFSSIFETRQLARVEYTGGNMQRISLFLSVYSLDPGKNLSVLVPLRTLPAQITGSPITEDDFRTDFGLDRVEREVKRQDTDEAKENLQKGVKEKMQLVGGSMLWSYPAEYTRQNIYERYSGSGKGDEDTGTMGGGDGGEYGTDEPEPVQTYEFDGFSIEVYGVTAGPTLQEHLEKSGLVLPDSVIFEAYMDQYVAVVESEAKPPIDPGKFDLLLEFAPDALDYVVERNRQNPRLEGYARWDLEDYASELVYQEYRQTVDEAEAQDPGYVPGATESDVQNAMSAFITAVFGNTNYDGEVVHMDVPLDNGKLYFPLGTSGGWPNAVGEIDVVFKVPEEKGLSVQNSTDVFFGGSHYYWFHLENGNPAFDLESRISPVDEDRRSEMKRAGFINDHWEAIGVIVNLGAFVVMYFGTALGVKFAREGKGSGRKERETKKKKKRAKGKKGRKRNGEGDGKEAKKKKGQNRVFTDPGIYIFLGLSLLVSIPGALLIYFLFKPMPLREIKGHVVPLTLLIMLPISLVFFFMGVMI